MKTFKKFIIAGIMSLFMALSAYAIDIEPEHDAILEEPVVITPPKYETAKVPQPKVPNFNNQALSKIEPQPLPQIMGQAETKNSVVLPSSEERIYYARSVTSNNPEYKTRFSILHNTPSPKRIAGERLYNLSDNFFRIKVVGNRIEILDNPVFNLIGINSAAGRYGEIRVLNGSSLTIHNTSKNFKGSWDLDGTGERKSKITPTNLISGVIPVHIKTYKPDGTVVSDETHDLTFKALAMGPYNGYWSDGADIGIFLWGMSNLKMKSQEMTYLGLDLGIVTQTMVDTTAPAPTEPNDKELLPSTMIPAVALNDTTVQPFGEGYNTGPYVGGLPFLAGIGSSGFGGNGFVGATPLLDCTKTPNDPRCLVDCTKTPNDPRCLVDCTKTPNDPRCLVDCTKTPNDPRCLVDCTKTPNDPRCLVDCTKTPNDPRCLVDCTKTPHDPRCLVDCIKNPTLPQCQDFCRNNPFHPQCTDFCKHNPHDTKCGDFCRQNPTHPMCCETEVDCKKNPFSAGCENYCTQNPTSPECCVLHPANCKEVDICVKNPFLAHCKDNPTTPVSEPFAPLVVMLSVIGYIFRRKTLKK